MTTDNDFMRKAINQAKKSFAAGEFPVGCVIADKNDIVAAEFRKGTTGENSNEIDHAEIMTLRNLLDDNPSVNMEKLTLFCTMEPCMMCFGAILLSGIKRIVYAYEDVMGGGTRCELSGLPTLYKDANITIVPHVMRRQSLELFKAFFLRPENNYWKNSLLAEYTLAQE